MIKMDLNAIYDELKNEFDIIDILIVSISFFIGIIIGMMV